MESEKLFGLTVDESNRLLELLSMPIGSITQEEFNEANALIQKSLKTSLDEVKEYD